MQSTSINTGKTHFSCAQNSGSLFDFLIPNGTLNLKFRGGTERHLINWLIRIGDLHTHVPFFRIPSFHKDGRSIHTRVPFFFAAASGGVQRSHSRRAFPAKPGHRVDVRRARRGADHRPRDTRHGSAYARRHARSPRRQVGGVGRS